MTKKQAIKFFNDLGYQCSYSGKQRTLFVHKTTKEWLAQFNLNTKFKIG
jgi:hypothetical protein